MYFSYNITRLPHLLSFRDLFCIRNVYFAKIPIYLKVHWRPAGWFNLSHDNFERISSLMVIFVINDFLRFLSQYFWQAFIFYLLTAGNLWQGVELMKGSYKIWSDCIWAAKRGGGFFPGGFFPCQRVSEAERAQRQWVRGLDRLSGAIDKQD